MEKYSLLSGQEFYASYFSNNSNYLMSLPIAFKIKGKLDIKRLEQTINQMIEDIDILRIKLNKDESTGKIYQYFEKNTEYRLNVTPACGASYEEKYTNIKNNIRELLSEARKTALKDSFQWDLRLFEMGEDEYIFYWRINHIVFDGVSIITLVDKLISGYNGTGQAKSAGFEDFIKEESEKRNTDDYKSLLEAAISQVKKCLENPLKINCDKRNKEETEVKEFVTLACKPFEKYCKEKKLSNFHISLLIYHASLAALYGVKETSIHVVIGNRKAKYKNTAGYMFLNCLSEMSFKDDMTMADALVECRDRYFHNSRLAPAISEAMLKEGNPTDFAITYQSYVPDAGIKIPFGEAEMSPITDDTQITNEPFNLGVEALSITEAKGVLNIMLMGTDVFFPLEEQRLWKKAFELAADCVLEDKTFKEFIDKYNIQKLNV